MTTKQHIALLLVLLLTSTQLVNSFSKMSHRAVGSIAQHFLTPRAEKNIKHYLREFQGSLTSVSFWADEIRNIPSWKYTGPFHYVNVDEKCHFNYARDCPKDNCIVGAITNYTRQLQSINKKFELVNTATASMSTTTTTTSTAFEKVRDAIRFIVHFVGDIHQPLHVGKLSDRGGNNINVKFYGKSANLHSIWDWDIPMRIVNLNHDRSSDKWVNSLINDIKNGRWSKQDGNAIDNVEWSKCANGGRFGNKRLCPEEWVPEIGMKACSVCYPGAHNGANLGDDYYLKSVDTMNEMIAKGGYRLAMLLNAAFETNKQYFPQQ